MSHQSPTDQQFQPGQLGLRHILGVMGAVSVVAALSAASLREMPPLRAGIVVVHWLLVALVAAGMYGITSLRRRRERIQAGSVLLSVFGRPLTAQRRRVVAWLLLSAVVLDGVVMSVFVLPSDVMVELIHSPSVIYLVFGQGLLWRYCLDHWVTNVYVVEFCEGGILTYGKFFRWRNITRLVWSPVQPTDLVIACDGFFHQIKIEPTAHAKVDEYLTTSPAVQKLGQK